MEDGSHGTEENRNSEDELQTEGNSKRRYGTMAPAGKNRRVDYGSIQIQGYLQDTTPESGCKLGKMNEFLNFGSPNAQNWLTLLINSL